MSSESRRAVVTGSSSGIGRSIATRLLADGWQVSGFDIAPASLTHRAFKPVTVDLCDGAAVEAATADAAAGSVEAYLLSPQAAAMTGQEIQVCGGASLEA